MADQFEAVVVQEAIDITARSGEIIIDANDAGALFEQALTEVGAEKSSPPVTKTRVSRCICGEPPKERNSPWRYRTIQS